MTIVGVIPARLNSKRLPEKVIYPILGRPIIYYVYDNAKKSELLSHLVVAVDNNKVAKVCQKHSIPNIMTSTNHRSGTERIIEVSNKIKGDIFVNIQGDEPLINKDMINQLVSPFLDGNFYGITSLKKRITDEKELNNPNVVKVVDNINNEAMYFSRYPIPYNKNKNEYKYFKHIGLYAYPKKILDYISTLPCSELEQTENLEQLRFLEYNIAIKLIETSFNTIGVDTKDDINTLEKVLSKRKLRIIS